MSPTRKVELCDGASVEVRSAEWIGDRTTTALVTTGQGGAKAECILYVLKNCVDERILIYVFVGDAEAGRAYGEVIPPSTDPVRAMLRCANRSGLGSVNREWRSIVEGIS